MKGKRCYPDPESGVAIILSLIFVIIVVGLVSSGTVLMSSNQKRSEVQFRVEGQATQFARSGLIEALNWFRRQTAQPVNAFAPVLDTTADPQLLETDEPDVGLVREFQIQGDVWGRYEVWKEFDSDPDSARLVWRKKFQVEDLSSERGFTGSGHVWRLRSIGYVFRRRSPVAFNEQPNQVLASVILESEIQRLTLKPPGQSAVSIDNGGDATVGQTGKVDGGATASAVLYPDSSPSGPSFLAGSTVTGSPPASAMTAADYHDDIKSVFGVRLQEQLRAMADEVITDVTDFPDPIPNNGLLFCEFPSITAGAGQGLNGTGAVYIKGNVTLGSGTTTSFNGLLYVDGNLTIREPAQLYGSIIVTGKIDVRGSGDYATVVYDDDALASLRAEVGEYRWSTAIREVDQQ